MATTMSAATLDRAQAAMARAAASPIALCNSWMACPVSMALLKPLVRLRVRWRSARSNAAASRLAAALDAATAPSCSEGEAALPVCVM